MYTRLYTNVLNHHHWMYSAAAQNHSYADTGFFTITASGPPQQLGQMTHILIDEFVKLVIGGYGETEFKRAKKQLQSLLLMNLESRPVIFEDLARQVGSNGERRQPEYFIEQIEAVALADLKRIAEKMLTSKPSVAVIGSLENLPALQEIEAGLLDKNRFSSGSRKKVEFS
jgi:processing peptidase subunit alpha